MLPAITNMKTSKGKVLSPLLSSSDGRTKLGIGQWQLHLYLFLIIVNNIQSKGRFAQPILFPLAGDRNIAKSWDRAMTMSTFYTIRYIYQCQLYLKQGWRSIPIVVAICWGQKRKLPHRHHVLEPISSHSQSCLRTLPTLTTLTTTK